MFWNRKTPDPPAPESAVRPRPDATAEWFTEHYVTAAGRVITLIEKYVRPLAGTRVADIGCGDGIIDLGVALRAGPELLTGFDVTPVDTDQLARRALEHDVARKLPANLEFIVNEPTVLPVDDAAYDVLFTWSAFEHIADPLAMLTEMRRIVRPNGILMLQLYPFYDSEHGSHLWDWYREGWAQHLYRDDEIRERLLASDVHSADWTEHMLEVYTTLNRVTVDTLGAALHEAGFTVAYLDLMSNAVMVPGALSGQPLSQLGITGVELLALPA